MGISSKNAPSTANVPLGVMVSATPVVADQLGISSQTDLTGLSVTWTAVTGRRYRITGTGEVTATAADGAWVVALTDAGNTQKKRATDACTTTSARSWTIEHEETGLSGSQTRKLRMQKAGGSGTVGLSSTTANNPATLTVEDIGNV